MTRLLPLVALLAGCSSVAPSASQRTDLHIRPLREATIHGDVRFLQEERWLVELACEELARFTDGRATFSVVWDWREDNFAELAPRAHITRRPAWTAKVQDIDGQHAGFRTLGFVDGQEIAIVAERCPVLYTVILHELGHYAGFEHVNDARAVMASNPVTMHFTAADRTECVRVGLCPKE